MTVSARTPTVDAAGKITISDDARTELGLTAGARLLETVVNGMLVYIPADADVLDASDDFARAVAAHGVTAEDLIADIEREKEAPFKAFYPDAE